MNYKLVKITLLWIYGPDLVPYKEHVSVSAISRLCSYPDYMKTMIK